MANITKPQILNRTGQTIVSKLSQIANAVSKKKDYTSFLEIQSAIRSGTIDDILSIGDTFTVNRATGATAAVTTGSFTVTLNTDTFYEKIKSISAKNYVFYYNGTTWLTDDNGTLGETISSLSSGYGITVTGTPVSGDKITVTVTTTEIEMQYVAKNKDIPIDQSRSYSCSFQTKYFFNSMQFDAPEAMISATTAMPAGTYHFYIPSGGNIFYLNSELQNKNVQFTTTVDIPAGGQLVISDVRYQTLVTGLTLTSYASGSSTTALESGITCSEGTSGTDLGSANTASNNTVLNSTDRTLYGNCRWKDSTIRQFLNSNAKKGTWWTPKNGFDRIPSVASSLDGFLYGLQNDFKGVLLEARKTTIKNWLDGGDSEVTSDTFFLLSMPELYMTSDTTEGSAYDYYSENSDLSSPGTGADSNRIKSAKGGSATHWWQRTPSSSYSNGVRLVYPTGTYDSNTAGNTNGVAPACIIA